MNNINSVDLQDAETSTFPGKSSSQDPKQKRNRKSRKVQEKCNERYRVFNNALGARDLERRHDERLGPLHVPATMELLQTIDPEPYPVTLSLRLINELIPDSVRFAITVLKVYSENPSEDIDIVTQVTKLQLAAKKYYAKRAAFVEVNDREKSFYRFVSEHFPDNIESIATYIDQVGLAKCEEQIIVPEFDSPDVSILTGETPVPLPEGFPTLNFSTEDYDGRGQQFIVGIKDENLAVAEGYIAMGDGGYVCSNALRTAPRECIARSPGILCGHYYGDTYEVLVERYQNWLNRCAKRISGSIRKLNIREGIGTVVQLIGSDSQSDGFGKVDVWCIRRVSDHVCYLGAGFQLGTATRRLDEIGYAVTRKRISRAGFVGRMVDLLRSGSKV